MKKSRIIIPALAMIAFSMVASISGAVAWFTAQRTATINAGTYAVVKTTSDLEVALNSGVGTSASGNTVTVGGRLTDGSFDHVNKNIYTPNESGTAIAQGDKGQISLTDANLATLLVRGETTEGEGTSATTYTVYTAVTFDLTFTVTFGAANNDVALLMDCSAGKTNFAFNNGTVEKTAKGFRMAFVSNAVGGVNNGATRVLADLQVAANCYYINDPDADLTLDYDLTDPEDPTSLDETTHAGVSYVSPALIDHDYDEDLPTTAQSASDLAAREDYLGYFDHTRKDSNSKVSLNYTVVCWYEGSDPEIKNRAASDFQAVTATLCFEAKDIA